MKKRVRNCLIAGLISGMAWNAYAVAPGFYLGLMGGPVSNNAKTEKTTQPDTSGEGTTTVTNTPKKSQGGARVFMGYKINPYASIELGGSYYSEIRYSTSSSGTSACGTPEISIGAVDLVGKGSIPLGSAFEVYAKAGVAGVYQHTSGALSSATESSTTDETTETTESQDCAKSSHTTQGRGTGSVGVSYDLSQNWVVDLSYNRLMTSGETGNLTMYALGFSYHFVDKYCGQFLCDD